MKTFKELRDQQNLDESQKMFVAGYGNDREKYIIGIFRTRDKATRESKEMAIQKGAKYFGTGVVTLGMSYGNMAGVIKYEKLAD